MFSDILTIALGSAEGSFVDVTVFAGIALILFGYLNFKKDGGIIKAVQKNKKFQPLVGALLGLTPGCGGAILIAPLYIKKTVTLGTVVAALIATMGDASFLLMTKSPIDFLLINILTFIVGVASGYLIDYLKIEKKLNLDKVSLNNKDINKACFKSNVCNSIAIKNNCHFEHIGHQEGDEIDLVLHNKAKGHQAINTIGFNITHKGYIVYLIVLFFGLIIGVSNLFSIDFGNGDASRVISIIGITGTLSSILFMIAGQKYFSEHTHEEEEIKLASLKETFIHTIEDIAFIGTWVFAAFFLYEISIYFIGGADYAVGEGILGQLMSSSGYYAVIVGALIGMIPGCGPQIVFVSLYLKGILPIEALIAHSISQDGDALLPIIAMDKKSALVVTVITTIIGMFVGSVLMLI